MTVATAKTRAAKTRLDSSTSAPVVLCIAGFDPSGGAGLQADIETITALGGRAVCAMTCNTIQNGNGVQTVQDCDLDFLGEQIASLTRSIDISSIKIGLLTSEKMTTLVYEALKPCCLPIVLDPIWRAGDKKILNKSLQALRHLLIPMATVATPNCAEILALVPESNDYQIAARTLIDEGCRHVLLTSSKSHNQQLEHLLISRTATTRFKNPRLKHCYHGSGCTLSSAIATGIAMGLSTSTAIQQAQDFTWMALKTADNLGHKQYFPTRRNVDKAPS